MATYTVQDTQLGKTITFEWMGKDAPTDADMATISTEAAKQAPAKPSLNLERLRPGAVPEVTEPWYKTLFEAPKSAAEAGLNLVTGQAFGMPAKVLTRAVAAPFVGTAKAEDWANQAANALTFQPETQGGKFTSALVGAPFAAAQQDIESNLGYPGKVAAETFGAVAPFKALVTGGPMTPQNWMEAQKVAREQPSRGGLTPEQTPGAQAAATEAGINVSPRAFKESMGTRALEHVSNLPVVREYTNKLRGQTNQLLVDKLDDIGEGLKTKEQVREFQTGKDALYQDAMAGMGDKPIDLPNTAAYMKKVLSEGGAKDTTRATITDYLDRIEKGGGFTQELVNDIMKDKKLGADRTPIKDRMLEDMGYVAGGDKAVQAIKAADLEYRFTSKSKMFNNFMGKVMEANGNERIINPVKWRNQYENVRSSLQKYHPDLVKKLDGVDQMVRLAGDDLGDYLKWQKDASNRWVSRIGGAVGLGGPAAAFMSPYAAAPAAGAAGTGMLLTRSAYKPGGLLRPKGLGAVPPRLGGQQ